MSNDPANAPTPGNQVPPEGTVPQPAVGWGSPKQGPVADGVATHDAAQAAGSQPAAGWGAPEQGQPAYGPSGQPAAGWGGPEQLYPQQGTGWGAQPASGSRSVGSRWRGSTATQKGLAAAAAAVVIAAGAGAAVWAATSSSADANGLAAGGQGFGGQGAAQGGPGGQAGAQNGQGLGGQDGSARGGFGAAGLGMGLLGQVLHGEFVVVQNNTNVTMVEQTGTVTAVSGQSVTVKSTDGFEQSYAISSSTQIGARAARGQAGSGSGSQSSTTTSLAQGQTVMVIALKDGLAAQTIAITGTN